MEPIERLGILLFAAIILPTLLICLVWTIPRFFNKDRPLGKIIIHIVFYGTLIYIIVWPDLFLDLSKMDGWVYFTGFLYALTLLTIIFGLIWKTEKESEANRIAYQLYTDGMEFLQSEAQSKGYQYYNWKDFIIENDRFKLNSSTRGIIIYSKEYDVWLLNVGNIFYCDENLNKLEKILIPYRFNLKRYLGGSRDL